MNDSEKSHLKPEELAWAELAEKASPGPWFVSRSESERDQDLLAAARSAVPALLKSLADARRERDEAREALNKAENDKASRDDDRMFGN